MSLKPTTQLQGITDLTLVADIKPGLVPGVFDSVSHASRLATVLRLLDAARRDQREAAVLPNPFADLVTRLRMVHFFRFAILPGQRQLLLNVTFDGGWEPYMRMIWGPLGTMLDLIFCHCEGYPQAALSSFDDYIAWVRRQEVPSQFFYTDGPGTVGDRAYYEALDGTLRRSGAAPGGRLCELAVTAPPRPTPSSAAMMVGVRTLKGLYQLTALFGRPAPVGAGPDDAAAGELGSAVLLRFAQDYLPDLRGWIGSGLLDPGGEYDALRPLIADELPWLMRRRWRRPTPRPEPPMPRPSPVQAGILQSFVPPPGRRTRGAVVLLRVTDADQALTWLKNTAPALIARDDVTGLDPAQVVCTLALTFSGLRRLGAPAHVLEAVPNEFAAGMEARAGVLGDLRVNHPSRWTRPRPNWTGGQPTPPVLPPIDLDDVHVLLQLRTAENATEAAANPPAPEQLLPRLQAWLQAHIAPASGLEVLVVEPGWSRPPAAPATRNHFGFADGVSQPSVAAAGLPAYWNDRVPAGELLLGRGNARGDGPWADDRPDAWMADGSFLVLRKISQNVGRFGEIVEAGARSVLAAGLATGADEARALVGAKLVGRHADGRPLVTHAVGANDFDYRHDTDGRACPFASHARRANPRTAEVAGLPVARIARRGLSYGPAPEAPGADPKAPRGTLFMALNSSIAEQFEVVQRWVAGGNASGVASAHPDPLVGVPRADLDARFRFVEGGQVIDVPLGTEPVCRVEWGLYAFMPSVAWLQGGLAWPAEKPESAVDEPRTMQALPAIQAFSPAEQAKAMVEDDAVRAAGWRAVREQSTGHVRKLGSQVLVADLDAVKAVLHDDGGRYSVCGYGERMAATLGASPFGEDDAGPTAGHARPVVRRVKEAIAAAVSQQQAAELAFDQVKKLLGGALLQARALGAPAASVDLAKVGAALVAVLCQAWFGIAPGPDVEIGGVDPAPTPLRCPGHFLTLARNVFGAEPNATVRALAGAHGVAVKALVPGWIDAALRDLAKAPPVLARVLEAITATASGEPPLTDEARNGVVANVILGLPATMIGQWVRLVRGAATDRSLWRWQQAVLSVAPQDGLAAVFAALEQPLRDAIAAQPVSDGIWRTVKEAHTLGGEALVPGDKVWLGLGAALTDPARTAADALELPFGGALGQAPHACPGRDLAFGALQGALAALLKAGEWAPTASPTTLQLRAFEGA